MTTSKHKQCQFDNVKILVPFRSSSTSCRPKIMLNDLNIFKDFNVLKAMFAVMTAYLLYDEISLFISKPTFTSISRAPLGPEHFPEIRVCPVPSFLQSELQRNGYVSSFDFSQGNLRNTGLKGWFGNQSDWNISVSTLTRVRDCPEVKIKFKKEKTISWQQPEMTITRAVYQTGSCCKAEIVKIGFPIKVSLNFD